MMRRRCSVARRFGWNSPSILTICAVTAPSLSMTAFPALAWTRTTADIYRSMRAGGHTPRSITDCLIAAIGLRVAATVVHNDVDFDRIAAAVPDLSVLRLPAA